MMEKKYQHMMEQVNMDECFASGLLERIREGRPKRRPRPLRTALIAACVCLALVGTAVAASDIIQQYFHTQVVDSYDEMIPEQSDGEESAIRFTAPSDNWPNQTADEAQADVVEQFQSSWEGWTKDTPADPNSGVTDCVTGTVGDVQTMCLTYSDGSTMEKYLGDRAGPVLEAAGLFSIDDTALGDNFSPVANTFYLTVKRDADQQMTEVSFFGMYRFTDGDGWFTLNYSYWPDIEFGTSYTFDDYYDTVGIYTRTDGIQVSYQIKDFAFWSECGTKHTELAMTGQNLSEEEILSLFEQFDLSSAVYFAG